MWPFNKQPAPEPAPVVERKTSVPNVARRNYSAAQSQARYGDLIASQLSADAELVGAISKVRAKARFLSRNSGTGTRYRQLMRQNVIGENGFTYQSRVRKTNDELDVGLNARVESEWAEFWEFPCTNSRLPGIDLLLQAMASYGTDGEIIWELVVDKKYPSNIAIHSIEADMLDETLNTEASNGNRIRMGVEVDKLDDPVAYWFLQDHPGDMFFAQQGGRNRHRRVPAERIIHVFDSLRPGQTRGAPPSSAVIKAIKMLDGNREAEVVDRRLRSAIGGFIESEIPAPQGIPGLSDGEDPVDEVLEMHVEPGTIRELPVGKKYKPVDPRGANSDFAESDTQFKKDIAMGLGISNMSLGMETTGVSYSAGRTVTQEDRDYYKMMHGFLIRNLIFPVFKAWLKYRVLSVETTIPATAVKRIIKHSVFRGRGWDWVDPAKDVRANSEALATGQTTLTQIVASRGGDINDHLSELKGEIDTLESQGLQHPFMADKTENEEFENKDDEDEDDEDEWASQPVTQRNARRRG